MAEGRSVHVIGAGIVGICTALYLQREGFYVTVVSRDAPGEACSSGNSGGFGVGLIAPIAVPGILKRVPRLLLHPREPLAIGWRRLPQLLPWFVRFAAASRPERVEAAADARASLCRRVFDAFAPLLHEAGAEHLVKREGMLFVYESRRRLANARYVLDVARSRGVRCEELDRDEIREREPALGPAARCGVLFPDSGHTVDPLRLVQTLAELFLRRGGTLLREEVNGFETDASGPRRIITSAGAREVDATVIAAGVWSKRLAAQLGSRVALEAERGYHLMSAAPGVTLRAPITLSDRNVVITPMEHGIRVTGMAELAGIEAPPNFPRAERVLRQAIEFLPGLCLDGASRWMGHRPSTPDSLPVIGPAPRYPSSVFYAFGHGHMGLAFAAITGKLVAALVAEREPEIDLAPFRADRF